MEGPFLDYYTSAVSLLKTAFVDKNIVYTNLGICIGLVSVAAFVLAQTLLRLLGGIAMATSRIIQRRLLSFEEVRVLNAKQMRKCVVHAIGRGTITKEQGDLMFAQMAKRFSRWEYLPKKKAAVPPAEEVKAAIRARLKKVPASVPPKAKTKLSEALSFLKPATT